MKKTVEKLLQSLSAGLTISSTFSDPNYIYTAYISLLIVDALLNEPDFRIFPRNLNGNTFVFPLNRSEIYSGSFSWYEIARRSQQQKYEMHLCCNCEGVSGFPHELDIVIVKHKTGEECRRQRIRPRRDEIVFLVECKNVGNVRYALGREFLGLCFEFPVEQESRRWGFRGHRSHETGALVAALSSAPTTPSAFRLLHGSNRSFITGEYVKPSRANHRYVRDFQSEVCRVLKRAL